MIHPLSDELREFVRQHADEDTDKLLLQAGRYPSIDIPAATIQIAARRQIREKLPEWYANSGLIFPSRLAAEQCSSEACAAYKQSLLRGENVCDLTGGLGVDSWYFSRKAASVTYIERNPDYCRAAGVNFRMLGAENIRIVEADATVLVGELSADTFYIDPARRATGNRRLFALSDCEPDILALKSLLLPRCTRLIVKTSPMADIGETLRLARNPGSARRGPAQRMQRAPVRIGKWDISSRRGKNHLCKSEIRRRNHSLCVHSAGRKNL